jgi:thymidylate kinase
MENAGALFFERVRNGYLTIARNEPVRFRVIDGMEPPEHVAQMIWNLVDARMHQKHVNITPRS